MPRARPNFDRHPKRLGDGKCSGCRCPLDKRRFCPQPRSRKPRDRSAPAAFLSFSCILSATRAPCRAIRATTRSCSTSMTRWRYASATCEAAGIPRERLIVDPGIGFGKTLAHNLALLGSLSIFHGLGCAVLLGASRKSFISKLTGALPTSGCRGRWRPHSLRRSKVQTSSVSTMWPRHARLSRLPPPPLPVTAGSN